jgi:hypothetical protein
VYASCAEYGANAAAASSAFNVVVPAAVAAAGVKATVTTPFAGAVTTVVAVAAERFVPETTATVPLDPVALTVPAATPVMKKKSGAPGMSFAESVTVVAGVPVAPVPIGFGVKPTTSVAALSTLPNGAAV